MAEYHFENIWRIAAPRATVWETLHEVESWPSWWPYVTAVQKLESGDDQGLGAVHLFTWRTRLPYTITFRSRATKVRSPDLLEAEAEGQVSGTGRWELSDELEGTCARYIWRVHTTQAWMNLLAPLARPVFEWNHTGVMCSGAEGLALQLNARLIEAR